MKCLGLEQLEHVAGLAEDDVLRVTAVEHASNCPGCKVALARAVERQDLLVGLRTALEGAPTFSAGTGDRIGECVLVRPLGEGGMGVVWEAEQTATGRRVALKLMRPGLATATAVRRFEREFRLLARLDHPGIARVFEAGGIDDGRPWFTMDLVDGIPITTWVRRHDVDTEGTLRLFVDVARAVRHAHEHGVVHRDLKPANVLVSDDGVPRVLDFGIAILADDSGPAMRATLPGELVGTLPYMSPEQARGALDVGTRSDVHGLGVILFELLTGALPRGAHGDPASEFLRAISRDPPRRASEIVAVPVDLDVVLAKALAGDPERRYATASAFADDVERFLAREPVTARPASLGYQLSMLARRHRTLVVASVITFLLLAGGLIATTMQAHRARAAETSARSARRAAESALALARERRAAAEREARRATVVRRFLEEVLHGANPMAGRRREPTVREVIDRAAARVEERFGDEHEIEAAVREILATSYFSLDEYGPAWEHMSRAAALIEKGERPPAEDLVRVWSMLALIATRRADRTEADHWIERTMSVVDGRPDLAPETLVATLGQAAMTRLEGGDPVAAEAMLRRAIAITEAAGRPARATTLMGLGHCLSDLGRFVEAEEAFARSLAIRFAAMGADHVGVAHAHTALSEAVRRQGRHGEAADHCREAIRILELRAPRGTALGSANLELAAVFSAAGNWSATIEPLERALDSYGRSLPDDHPQIGQVRSLLGDALMRLDRMDEAGEHLAVAVSVLRSTAGSGRMVFARAVFLYGQWLRLAGRRDDAEELLESVLEEMIETDANRTWRARMRVLLGRLLLDDGLHREAEVEMLAGHEVLRSVGDGDSLRNLIDLYHAWGKPDRAEALERGVRDPDR